MAPPKPEPRKGPSVNKLKRAYAALAPDAGTLRRKLPKLRALFERAGRLDLLLDLLLAAGSAGFAEADLLLEIYLFADAIGRRDAVTRRIVERRADGGLVALPWRFDFKLGRMGPLGGEAAALIVQLKYDGIVADPDDPLAAARMIGPRILFPDGLLDTLFAVSRFQSLGRAEWEAEVRTAFALEHLTSDLQNRRSDLVDFDRLLDREAIARALAPFADRAVLCIIFHGGYLALAKMLFAEAFPEGVRMQRVAARGPNEISVADDVRVALFSALEVLRQERALMLAPDAGIGRLRGGIPVLGRIVPAAEGAAFLAYEMGCRSIWLAIVREGDRFVAETVDAPVPLPEERFASFRTRFFAFVGARIDDLLTGDPRNLVMRTPMASILSARLGGVAGETDEPAG